MRFVRRVVARFRVSFFCFGRLRRRERLREPRRERLREPRRERLALFLRVLRATLGVSRARDGFGDPSLGFLRNEPSAFRRLDRDAFRLRPARAFRVDGAKRGVLLVLGVAQSVLHTLNLRSGRLALLLLDEKLALRRFECFNILVKPRLECRLYRRAGILDVAIARGVFRVERRLRFGGAATPFHQFRLDVH